MNKSKSGFFVAIEGLDGAGKSTLCDALFDWLTQSFESAEYPERVTRVFDPGSTTFGTAFRRMIKDVKDSEGISPVTRFLGFCASRRQMVDTVVEPAVLRGRIVLSDRFVPSTIAYQGFVEGVMREIGQAYFEDIIGVAAKIVPHLYIHLRISPEIAKKRLEGSKDAFDRKPLEHFQALSIAYDDAFSKFINSPVTHIQVDDMLREEVLAAAKIAITANEHFIAATK
jgi:dTMP kinase